MPNMDLKAAFESNFQSMYGIGPDALDRPLKTLKLDELDLVELLMKVEDDTGLTLSDATLDVPLTATPRQFIEGAKLEP